MSRIASADIVIFGGGIAGLWLLNRLRESGLSVILFESGSLGGGQTNKSQGIIHGGMKYALQGTFTQDAKALAEMPEVWRQCLKGEGDIDLSAVPILSQQQYLWSPNKFTSKIAGFLASTALNSKISQLNQDQYPEIFRNSQFKGEVFALDEVVIDIPSLVRELAKNHQDAIFKIEPLNEEELRFDEQGTLLSATVYLAGRSVEIKAQQFIFTAGAGNEIILHRLKDPQLAMQRRPLHMVLVKLPFETKLYAHCMGLGARPRITITTHRAHDGSTIWYLGGQLAEDGIDLDTFQQCASARKELKMLFPWVDFSQAEFSSFFIDRAEPLQKSGFKPENSFVKAIHNILIGWPTKLALAPKLAEDVLQLPQIVTLTPQTFDTRELRSWPMPPLATPVWDTHFTKILA